MSKAREYLDFEIHLQNLDTDANQFQVFVPRIEGVGETSQPIEVPYQDKNEDLEFFLSSLDRNRADMETVTELGKLLTERLLPQGEIRDLFQDARRRAGSDGGVRLRIVISAAKADRELARIPWEYVIDPDYIDEKEGHFLALDPRMSIVRHIARPSPQGSLEAREADQLKLAALLANATVAGQKKLELDVDKQALESAFQGFDVQGVTLDWQPLVEHATRADLNQAVLSKPDILHFSGHGLFDTGKTDPETGKLTYEGKLAFQTSKEDLSPALVDAETLGRDLAAAGARLVVLGACQSGRQDGVSLWTGIAPAMVRGGVPAVVAMQYEVVDSASILFNQAFYNALGAGLSVEEAVSHGRRQMLEDVNIQAEKNVQWGIPVLYMRAGDGVLFPRFAKKETDRARAIRLTANDTIEVIKAGASYTGVRLKLTERSSDRDIEATSNLKIDTLEGNATGVDFEF